MNPRYLITVEFQNIRAEVWLNRIPVGTATPKDGSPVVLPVNQFIVAGTNKLGLLLNFGPSAVNPGASWENDAEAQRYRGPVSVKATIALYQPEQVPMRDHPAVLATVEWKGEASPHPQFVEKTFDAAVNFGTWAWETAPALPGADGALRIGATEYLSLLYRMLAQRHFEAYVAESATKFDEMGRAYGVAMEPLREAMLKGLHAQEQEHLLAFDPNALDLRPVANDRMLECFRHNREYLFEYDHPNSANRFFLPLMIGKVRNKWMILR